MCYSCRKKQLRLSTTPKEYICINDKAQTNSYDSVVWSCSKCFLLNLSYFNDSSRRVQLFRCNYCNSFVEYLIEYCTTCHWRNCTINDDLNFKTNCICSKKKKHKKIFVKICNSYYSFKCKICKQTHDLVVTKPLQFYCPFQTITSDTYNHWNRQSTHFCGTCLLNRRGKNLGFCWFCEICKQHQLNYVNGS